jgi:hemoglobin-like flavoprotein
MQQKQKEIVRQTWKQLVPIADTATTLFYQRLFEIDSSTRPLFSGTDMPEQRRKLMQVIGFAVNGLDCPTWRAALELWGH